MVGNAHLDPVWLWPWQEGYMEARATFQSAIDRMAEYDDFVFTCDQVVLLSWVQEADPELFEQIRRRVAEGRWVLAGGWWVEPDCNMPSGESLVRQGLIGQRWLADRFGVIATVGMNVDPFGHNVMLPQILRGQRMDSYLFLRPGPHESDLDATAFWWISPDGSSVLAYRIPFEYCSPPGDVAGQAEKSLGQLDRSLGDVMVFYGVGNHGGGPTRANIDSIHRYNAMGSFGRMQLSSPRRYLDELAARRGLAGLAERTDDLQHHARGCYSAHSGIKAWVRRGQAALLVAERWAAIGAARHGLAYPGDELTHAWQQLLFNQFHDVLPGSAIAPAYDDARDQLGEAVSIAKRITTRVHNVLARQVDIPFEAGTQPLLVFNPHPWAVTTDVELQYGVQPTGVHVVDGAGQPVCSQPTQSLATTDDKGRGAVVFGAQLPALGYRLYRLRAGPPTTGLGWADQPGLLEATSTRLENEHLQMHLDPQTGWLTSLRHKEAGLDVVDGAAGPHTVVSADHSDTWGHRVVSYAVPGEMMRTTSVVLRESGPQRARIRVERQWGRSTLVEELIMRAGADELEVRVTLDWREPAHLLKLRVPVALEHLVGTFEIPFGAMERPVDGAEEPGQSWVDLTGTIDGTSAGLALINDAKHAYDLSPAGDGNSASVGVTAVRSPVYAWHDPRLLDPAGAYDYQDQGIQRFTYSLVPHAGDWRAKGLTRRAAVLGCPVRAMLEPAHHGSLPPTASFADDRGGAVMITTLKGAEGTDPTRPDLVLRAVETRGRPARAVLRVPFTDQSIQARFRPHQIRTWRLPASGGQPVEVDLLEWTADEGPPDGPIRRPRARTGQAGRDAP